MSTLDAILKEMKEVPVNRLDELYQFIHSMTTTPKLSEKLQKKIIFFGGAFSDISEKDYPDYLDQTMWISAGFLARK